MPVQVVTTVVNSKDLDAKVAAFIKKGGDLKPLYNGPIDVSVTSFFQQQFATAGRIGGTPWPSLTPFTIDLKRRSHRENMGILRHTNRLWASLTKRAGPNVYRRITNTEYERGTTIAYAGVHQKGYKQLKIFGKPRKAPTQVGPRPLVPDEMPAQFVNAWESLTLKYILGEVKA